MLPKKPKKIAEDIIALINSSFRDQSGIVYCLSRYGGMAVWVYGSMGYSETCVCVCVDVIVRLCQVSYARQGWLHCAIMLVSLIQREAQFNKDGFKKIDARWGGEVFKLREGCLDLRGRERGRSFEGGPS